MASGQFGVYIGNLQVTFDDSGDLTNWQGDTVRLTSSTPNDEAIEVYRCT